VGWKVDVDRDVQGKQKEYHLALAKVLSRMDFVPNERKASLNPSLVLAVSKGDG
jgi:hypothetical protein